MGNEHTSQTPDDSTAFPASTLVNIYTEDSPDEFSIRSENSADKDIGRINCDIPCDLDFIGAVRNQTQVQDLDVLIKNCLELVKALHSDNEKSENTTRKYLTNVGLLVHSDDFDIQKFAQRFEHKRPSQANLRNPYLFVMKCIGGTENIQQASNQSLALTFAIQKCYNEKRELSSCFNDLSIRECLRLFRNEKSGKRKNRTSTANRGIKVNGVPINLLGRGKISVELEFDDKGGHFIRLLPS